MAIYRGAGGAGDATNDATSQAIIASEAAIAAAASQASAAASALAASNSASAASSSAAEAAASAASIDPSDLVHISGSETITGTKTFGANPILSLGTANGVAFLNGSKAVTTSPLLQFDGANLGLGLAPSAWGSAYEAFQFNTCGNINATANAVDIGNNYFVNEAGTNVSLGTNFALKYQLERLSGEFRWLRGVAGAAGNTISFTQAMVLNSSGNLGIGTSSPGTQLDVNNGAANATIRARTGSGYSATLSLLPNGSGSGIALAAQGDNSAVLYNQLNSYLAFGTNNTERMRIDSAGNVGIGTSSPAAKLHLSGASGNTYTYITTSTVEGAIGEFAVTGIFNVGSTSNHPLGFRTNNTERMRIDSSGNLLVGRTSGSGVKLNVSAAASNHSALFATQTSSWASLVAVNTGGSGTRNFVDFRLTEGGANVGSITTDGSTTSYNTSSDYRLKENIQPMQNALDVVAQLNPVTYTWKADGSDGQGFIAHELQAVVPDCVTGEKDAVDKDGKPVYQGIDTSFLVATLTKAIQELKARVEQLENAQ